MCYEIKDIPELPDVLKEAANNRKLAVFVGAGISRFIGCSGWRELADNLLKRCCKEGLINYFEQHMLAKDSDIKKIITICNALLSKKKCIFMDEIKRSLNDDVVNQYISKTLDSNKLGEYERDRQVYKDIFSLGAVFVTTNVDRHIDTMFEKSNIFYKQEDFRPILSDKNFMNQNRLYKIHGSIVDEDSLVLDVIQYKERYADDGVIQFLQSLFQNYHVLFLGYGLGEFELLNHIVKTDSDNEKHFYLNGYFTSEKRLCGIEQEYFSKLGITLIPYSKDNIGYVQQKAILEKWANDIKLETYTIDNIFTDIDDALEKQEASKIDSVIQRMQNDVEYKTYFFKKAPSYKNLDLWLKPLFDKGFFDAANNSKPIEDANYKGSFIYPYWDMLDFLDALSLQNISNPKDEVTDMLLYIIDSIIDKDNVSRVSNNRTDEMIIKILFNLPHTKITLAHMDFIHRVLKDCISLRRELGRIVLSVLTKHNMKKHLLVFLKTLFDYRISSDASSKKKAFKIGGNDLDLILEGYSSSIAKIVGVDGVDVIASIMEQMIREDMWAFNVSRVVAVEINSEHMMCDKFEYRFVLFLRDLLENLCTDKLIKSIKKLLKKKDSIFQRVAIYSIDKKYDELKDIFWSWLDSYKDFDNKEELATLLKHELYKLLENNKNKFSKEEKAKVIEWVERLDYTSIYLSGEEPAKINAYYKKEWLLSLKSVSGEAEKLYRKYDSISPEKIEHPGYDAMFYSYDQSEDSDLISDYIFDKSVEEIVFAIRDFDPSQIEQSDTMFFKHTTKERNAAKLSKYIAKNPNKYALSIDSFVDIDWMYKYYLLCGLKNAWSKGKEFDWGKVFDFLLQTLDDNFFKLQDRDALRFRKLVADLIKTGMKDDANAFNKKYLLEAKEVLFRLLKHPVDVDKELSVSAGFMENMLNSINGMVLCALISYALRYGKLHSDQEVKWEDDIEEFFTKELKKDTEYTRLVICVLSIHLEDLIFLDRKWLHDNFNKIFPKGKKELWEIAMSGYFPYARVNRVIYERLIKDGHIQKALKHNFSNDVKRAIVKHICVASANSKYSKMPFDVIESKDAKYITNLIVYMAGVYKNMPANETRNYILKLWGKLYETFKDDKTSDASDISKELLKWFVFIDTVDDEILPYMKLVVRNAKLDYDGYIIVEELERMAKKSPKFVGELYIEMLTNGIYLVYDAKHIISTVSFLFERKEQDIALKICNLYKQKGYYFLDEVSKKR
ncbi:hypothetical protein BKH43_06945 [Helicobacter sp. 13S00401-1]|uniref:SIR2 family protein n=1 Tax=Helicobacter sp. 13S00401-1 TaxID=1905758 RepID=UPI000BA6AF98|nr:SIR2 family protein [Helicobacter sp. 13S00401-1]PAF49312.1 hypothetical protein BKH43_06945 [Helicobacter sp. 13S00401-1]